MATRCWQQELCLKVKGLYWSHQKNHILKCNTILKAQWSAWLTDVSAYLFVTPCSSLLMDGNPAVLLFGHFFVVGGFHNWQSWWWGVNPNASFKYSRYFVSLFTLRATGRLILSWIPLLWRASERPWSELIIWALYHLCFQLEGWD